MRYAECHPDKKHKGRGLCNTCWQREWRLTHPGQQWQERHPEESKAYQQAWYQGNKERIAERRKNYRLTGRYKTRDRRIYLAYKYGLTLDEYRERLIGQAGRCLICLRVPDKDLVVDHDHATGRVRGLLCHACNQGIGHFADLPDRLKAAARYLQVTP